MRVRWCGSSLWICLEQVSTLAPPPQNQRTMSDLHSFEVGVAIQWGIAPPHGTRKQTKQVGTKITLLRAIRRRGSFGSVSVVFICICCWCYFLWFHGLWLYGSLVLWFYELMVSWCFLFLCFCGFMALWFHVSICFCLNCHFVFSGKYCMSMFFEILFNRILSFSGACLLSHKTQQVEMRE